MLKVALTGGIATGKSYVLERFRSRGVPCLDADALAHGVTAAGTEATRAIAARFGAEVIGEDGALLRAKLGPIVFGDRNARRDLEAIVHPAVYRAIAAGIRGFELLGERLVVIDVPLLFETGRRQEFDRVIVTACPPEVQIQRLMERNGLTEHEARARLAAQMSTEAKMSDADFVIRTGGTFEETDRQVDDVYGRLLGGVEE